MELNHFTWYHGDTFCTSPLGGELTGHRWIPLTKGQQCGALVSSMLFPNKMLHKMSIVHCKNWCFGKTHCRVVLENHTFPNIFIFKTCQSYLDTGNDTYLGELSVSHGASISSLSFSTVFAVVTFQHVEILSPGRCFSLTLFWKHFLTCWNV